MVSIKCHFWHVNTYGIPGSFWHCITIVAHRCRWLYVRIDPISLSFPISSPLPVPPSSQWARNGWSCERTRVWHPLPQVWREGRGQERCQLHCILWDDRWLCPDNVVRSCTQIDSCTSRTALSYYANSPSIILLTVTMTALLAQLLQWFYCITSSQVMYEGHNF